MNRNILKPLLAVAALLCSASGAWACDPFAIWDDSFFEPLPKFHFYQEDEDMTYVNSLQAENVGLWKRLTSRELPDSAVVEGVYKIKLDSLRSAFASGQSGNAFLQWINDHEATELRDFLLLAKELEELRMDRVSPWYYPTDKNGYDEAAGERAKFDSILNRCDSHRRGPLSDRYALQAVRALMSMGEYQRCVELYQSRIVKLPASNLFRRMAEGYIAGCYARMGETQRANKMYAQVGDFVSLQSDDRFEAMARSCPESCAFKIRLNSCIGYADTAEHMRYYRMADIALRSPKVKHRGDWLYLKAYIEYHYLNNTPSALRLTREAMACTFSMPQMRDDARLFLLSSTPGYSLSSSEIKWMTDHNTFSPWRRAISDLWQSGQKTKALLVANYDVTPDENRTDYYGHDHYTWANAGFQLLLSCKASDVIAYRRELLHPTMALTRALKSGIRCDDDYLCDIIGTLYLREGRYVEAAKWLERVGLDYQKQMNLYRGKYLSYNPWEYYSIYEDKWNHPWSHYSANYYHHTPLYGRGTEPTVMKSQVSYLKSQDNAKLNFAREMARLETVMKTDPDPDARTLARMRHAIGRYNSLNTCWALTQYWLGSTNQRGYAEMFYYVDRNDRNIRYIIDTPRELTGLQDWYAKELTECLKALTDPELQAQAHLILRNYRTLAKHYHSTQVGREVASRCDGWADWL